MAPLNGYRGEHLHCLIIRDLTGKKKHQDELSQYWENLEKILTIKINELKESERLCNQLAKQLMMIGKHLTHHPSQGDMVGSSKALHDIRNMIFQISKSDTTVLITGESGTGKELVANMIHETCSRNQKPFLKINCNAINESLLESELFGYERGAFTGANNLKIGKFEAADGGTIFLDEIGHISSRMQAALLRILQDGSFMRVGGNTPTSINVRIIAATNVDLTAALSEGSFRLDLFYRLKIIHIPIPPLRERKDDIPELVSHFLGRFKSAFGKDVKAFPRSTMEKLLQHQWPGNVRELENVIQRAVLISNSNIITNDDLAFESLDLHEPPTTLNSLIEQLDDAPLKKIVAEIEKEVLRIKLKRFQGSVAQAAEQLMISKTALYDKLKRYDLNPKDLR